MVAGRRVAVAGGGLAGLAAALDLTAAGCTVELFERSRLLGGRATSFEIDGIEVDNGQHVFLGACTEFIGFVERAGMGGHLRLADRFDVVVFARDGQRSRLRAGALPAPLHVLWSFLGYRHLGWRAKVQIARALAAIRAAGPQASVYGDESFASWLGRHRQGTQAVRAFWEPFMVPALNVPLAVMPASEAAFVIATAFLGEAGAARFGYTTVPLAHVAAAAAARLHAVHRSHTVSAVVPGTQVGVRVDGADARFDGLVLAVPPRAAARLLADPALAGYEARAIVDVHLWHDSAALDFEFAALLDSPVQWVFVKGPGYLACSLSAADDHLRRPTAELAQLCWAHLRASVPQLRAATLVRSAVTRNPESTYLPLAGTVRPGPRTAHANIVLAGSWTATGWPDTMESAVRSGRAAAAALLAAPAPVQRGDLEHV